jgi:hypothetical protein
MRRTFLILCIIALVVTCNNLMAQDDKTSYDRSRKISDQLKNGTAPGLKFGPVSKKRKVLKEPTAEEKSVRFSQQLRSGTLPGTNAARGGGGTVNRTARRASASKQPMASDQPSGSQPLKAAPAPGSGVKEPSQGGMKEPDLSVYPKNAKKAVPAATGSKETKQ